MINSFVFNDGKLVGSNLDSGCLAFGTQPTRAFSFGLISLQPTPEEAKDHPGERYFPFIPSPLKIAMSTSRYPKIEDYEDYLLSRDARRRI